jgi:hypothetical protein
LNCSEKLTISCGRKPSLSSEPGTRSAATSKWLMTLRPFWMKVLSPQLTAWRPTRNSAGMLPRLKRA